MNSLLKERKTTGQTLYAFIEKVGEERFFGHLGAFARICRLVKNPKELDRKFYEFYPECNPNKTLPLFPEDFKSLVLLDIQKLTQKERPKKIENDLFMNEVNKNTKIIEAIQQERLDF